MEMPFFCVLFHDIMSAREREQAKPAHRERRMPIMNEVHDIMGTKEKQATPKAAFVFLVPLENEQPAQQAIKRVSAGS